MKKVIQYLLVLSVSILLSMATVHAQSFITCLNKVSTGKEYYNACCDGNYLIAKGYYSSSSEAYTVMNYIGINDNYYTYSAGCHAGKRNAIIQKNMNTSFKKVAHTHSYVVHRN